MAVIIGSEYLTKISGAASGLATLDALTHVTTAQLNLPDGAEQPAGLVSGKLPADQLTLPANTNAVAGLSDGKLTTAQIPLPSGTEQVAGLDGTGKIPETALPTSARNPFRGEKDTEAALADIPSPQLGDYAFVNDTSAPGFFYWNSKLTTPKWDAQKQLESYLTGLTAVQRAAVPYIQI